jgi:hypothetical protein
MKMEIRKIEKCETIRKKIDDNKKENILSGNVRYPKGEK